MAGQHLFTKDIFFFFWGGERSPKNNYQLHSIIGVARHLWEDVCLFVESESFDTGGPNTCPAAIEHFLKKRRKHFPTFSLLSLLDSLTHTSHGRRGR